VSSNLHGDHPHLTCQDCTDLLQEYLDGTLAKETSLQVFLHLRQCTGCSEAVEQWKTLFTTLDDLPDHAPPADFDQRILASVPYEAYRAMEPLRRDRVPVFLESDALPGVIRSPVARGLGVATAVVVVAGVAFLGGPREILTVAGAGLLPEILVRLQAGARHVVLSVRRSEGGA